MQKFLYKVRDPDGKVLTGIMTADTDKTVANIITEKGYFVVSVRTWSDKNIFTTKKVDLDTLIRFTQKLGAMLKAGIAILVALRMLWEQTENNYLQIIISDLITDLSQGLPFSRSLRKYPDVFSDTYVSLVEIGEKGGDYPQALQEVSAHLIRQRDVQQKVQKALMYPVIVVVASILVVAAMLTLVVPAFNKAFVKMNIALPPLTQILVNVSDFSVRFWWVGILILIGMTVAYVRYKRTPRGAYAIDVYKLKIPVIGDLLFSIALSRFLYSLYALLSSGVVIAQTIESAGRSSDNRLMEEKISIAGESIAKGKSISASLAEVNFFPVFFIQMISIGEASGQLTQMLRILIDFLDEEIDFRMYKVFTLLGPIAIGIVGVLVLVIMLAIYFPIFSLWGSIK